MNKVNWWIQLFIEVVFLPLLWLICGTLAFIEEVKWQGFRSIRNQWGQKPLKNKHNWGIPATQDGPRICRKCGVVEGYEIGRGFINNTNEECKEKEHGD